MKTLTPLIALFCMFLLVGKCRQNMFIFALIVVVLCIDRIHSFPYVDDDQESMEDIKPLLNRLRSESAERYFDWASKTQRESSSASASIATLLLFFLGPMEYFRGKRFWLFTKKDENDRNLAEPLPVVQPLPNSLNQGIWRSGIVGRR
jgi:hypothetical protein